MKNVQRYLNPQLHDETDDGTGGGGGAGGGQQQQVANGGQGNNNNDHLISHEDLWQSDDEDGNGNVHQQQQQNAGGHGDPNAAFQAHIDSLDFTGGIDIHGGMEAIRNGDTEAFGNLLRQVSANAYRNAMVDANKVVQQRVDKMGNDVQQRVATNQTTSELVREMGNQLPFTKNAAYAPVAKLVLTKFLRKGATSTEAIAQVGKYFQSLSGEVGKMNPRAPSGRPSGGFGGNNSSFSGGNESEATDWMEVLGGPQN